MTVLELGLLQLTELPQRRPRSASVALHGISARTTRDGVQSPLLSQFIGRFVLKAVCNVLTQHRKELKTASRVSFYNVEHRTREELTVQLHQ
jgi:hypothetical protein